MRIVQYDKFGPAEVLYIAQQPIPTVADGGILVRVHGAGIGGGESNIREGKVALIMGKKFPAYMGVEFSGVIEDVGPGTSGNLKTGDRVWGIVPHGTFGAVAEYVSVPESRVAPIPANLDTIEAAALPAAGTTVIRALSKEANLQKGERVLIRGGSGGVGNVAVQYAKFLGAGVVALGGASSIDWLRELGADEVFDYRKTSLQEIGSFDVILDVVGTHISDLRRILTPTGRMVELGYDADRLIRSMFYIVWSSMFGSRRIHAFSNNPSASDFAQLTQLAQDGAIKPIVRKVWPVTDVIDAVKEVERGGIRGKHVVRLV